MKITLRQGISERKGHAGGDLEVVVMDDLRRKFPERFDESGEMDWEWFKKDILSIHNLYMESQISVDGEIPAGIQLLIQAAIALIKNNMSRSKTFLKEDALAIVKLKEALYWVEQNENA